MSPNDFSDRVSTVVEKAEGRLTTAVTKAQNELFQQMQVTLSKLDLDADGLIKQSNNNRKILQKADTVFNKAIKESGYYTNLETYADSVLELTKANEKYFTTILDTFTIDAQYLKSLQKSAIGNIETLLANEGLELQLKQPLMQILNQNVNSGASLTDLTKQVQEFIKGTADTEGKLMRYSKQISSDTLFNYSRSVQESISQNAGLEFYFYQGGIMDTTRAFCASRAGKYFGKKEVEAWAKLGNWDGRRPGTTQSTIFIYCGGFQCRHQLIPVSEAIVPKEVVERNS